MSATADAAMLGSYFAASLRTPVARVAVDGRSYPVETLHLEDALAATRHVVRPAAAWCIHSEVAAAALTTPYNPLQPLTTPYSPLQSPAAPHSPPQPILTHPYPSLLITPHHSALAELGKTLHEAVHGGLEGLEKQLGGLVGAAPAPNPAPDSGSSPTLDANPGP